LLGEESRHFNFLQKNVSENLGNTHSWYFYQNTEFNELGISCKELDGIVEIEKSNWKPWIMPCAYEDLEEELHD